MAGVGAPCAQRQGNVATQKAPAGVACNVATQKAPAGVACSASCRLSIEGNIGAGKSTFLRLLAEEMDFFVVPEPLSKWQHAGDDGDFGASQESGSNLLEMFYESPTRWGCVPRERRRACGCVC
jgi:hypothetical protein